MDLIKDKILIVFNRIEALSNELESSIKKLSSNIKKLSTKVNNFNIFLKEKLDQVKNSLAKKINSKTQEIKNILDNRVLSRLNEIRADVANLEIDKKANTDHADKFKINDIYRILVDNFDRDERIALALRFAKKDHFRLKE